jgi:hypothetical protein
MFRHLYKTILISILSSALLCLSTLAIAEDTTAISKMSKTSATGFVREKDGTLTKTETHSFSGNKGDDDNFKHSLTMLAVGFVGMKLLTYAKWTPDMTVAAVASGLYISSEVMNIINMKKQLSDVTAQTIKRNDGKMDQAQIEALEKLKASYESAKKSVKMRKNLQTAAAAAFLVAAGIATAQNVFRLGLLAQCQTALTVAMAKMATCAAATGATGVVTEAGFCTSCGTELGVLNSAIVADLAKQEAPVPSSAILAADSAASSALIGALLSPTPACVGGKIAMGIKLAIVTPVCSQQQVYSKLSQGFGAIAVLLVQNNELDKILMPNMLQESSKKLSLDSNFLLKNKLQTLVDLIIPRAEAGGTASLLGITGGLVGTFLGVKTAVAQAVDSMIFTPLKRIMLWGILGTAAERSANSSQDELKKIEENIAKIDKILAEIYTLEKGITASNVGTQSYSVPINTNIDANADTPLFPNDKKAKTDCLTPSCTPIPDTFKGMPEFAGLPDSFKSIASQVASLGNGLSGTGTLSGATMAGATSLGNNHNAIAKTVGEMKKKLNESLAKNGKAKIDFDKEEKNAWGKMKSGVAKALQEKGTSASSLLSSMGLSPISSANATPAPAAAVAPKKATIPGGGVIGAGAAPAKGMQFDFKEATAEGGAPDAAAELAAKNEELDLGSNDINTNSGESIFQVISNRYIKSGYPKLLEEIPVKK